MSEEQKAEFKMVVRVELIQNDEPLPPIIRDGKEPIVHLAMDIIGKEKLVAIGRVDAALPPLDPELIQFAAFVLERAAGIATEIATGDMTNRIGMRVAAYDQNGKELASDENLH